MLKGIDVSSHNGWPYNSVTQKAYNQSDFVIIKATQGTGYINPGFGAAMGHGQKDGKLLGMYHYAGGGNALDEAKHFWSVVEPWNGIAIPVLDFEQYQNEANWNDTLWAKRFCEKYHELSGKWPMIYIQASAIARVSICSPFCALWIAGYPTSKDVGWDYPRFNYPTSPWATWTCWQYTSTGGVDRNVAQLSAESWDKIAKAGGSTVNASSQPTQIAKMARDVINGKYGNGLERKNKLGSDYKAVQEIVNALIGGSSEELADMAIAGKLGNGDDRKYILGKRYATVQKIVNSRM